MYTRSYLAVDWCNLLKMCVCGCSVYGDSICTLRRLCHINVLLFLVSTSSDAQEIWNDWHGTTNKLPTSRLTASRLTTSSYSWWGHYRLYIIGKCGNWAQRSCASRSVRLLWLAINNAGQYGQTWPVGETGWPDRVWPVWPMKKNVSCVNMRANSLSRP